MFSLNDTNVYVGEIKQLLANTNLPKCQVGKKFPADGCYFIDKYNIGYWKKEGNKLVEKISGIYSPGKSYLNLTENFDIDSMLYDRKTHRYLGRYLRFLRDYHNLDLMCMYNCFDRELIESDISFEVKGVRKTLYTDSSTYTTYKIPVSLVKDLTIYLHSINTVEMFLHIDIDDSNRAGYNSSLAVATYQKRKITVPYLYKISNLRLNDELKDFVYSHLTKLVLILKIPNNVDTSIVVLEGDYTKKVSEETYPISYILEEDGKWECKSSNIPIKPKLLSYMNSTSAYLLSDNIIQYLSENATTNISNQHEVSRLQQSFKNLRETDEKYHNVSKLPDTVDYYYGIWSDIDKQDIQAFICQTELQTYYDKVPYMDRDVEQLLKTEGLDDVEL